MNNYFNLLCRHVVTFGTCFLLLFAFINEASAQAAPDGPPPVQTAPAEAASTQAAADGPPPAQAAYGGPSIGLLPLLVLAIIAIVVGRKYFFKRKQDASQDGPQIASEHEPENSGNTGVRSIGDKDASTAPPPGRMTDKLRNQISFWVGLAGGGIFLWANIATNGQVPGGAVGGILGMVVFGGASQLVLWLYQKNQERA